MLTACAGFALSSGASTFAATAATAATGEVAIPLASPTTRTVTLVTGDRVTITTAGGHSAYTVADSSGAAREFVSYQDASGDQYVVPAEAGPYLGRQLSASLFDVSALLRDGLTTGAHIPVSLAFAAGSAPSAPPGVTLTSSGASTATGYSTAQSGAAFAAGLRTAIGADVAAGRHVDHGALFGGLASISLAAPGAVGSDTVGSGTVQPRYPLQILQFNVTDITGAPADNVFIAYLVNTDSVSRERTFVHTAGGITRIAVPAGDYSAIFEFADFDAGGNFTAVRSVIVNDFTVPAGAPTTTVGVDERTATVPFSVTTPRPATNDGVSVNWSRQDSAGVAAGIDTFSTGGGVSAYSNSQPAAKVGKLRYVAQWGAAGPATGAQYRYDLAYGSDDVPADQTYVAQPNQVAAVHLVFSSDPASSGAGLFTSVTYDGPNIISFVGGGAAVNPGPMTDYLGDGDGGQWLQSFITQTGLYYRSDVHTYAGGHSYQQEWAHGPLAPGVGQHTGTEGYYSCFACTSGNVLSVRFDLSGDSEPDHSAQPFGINETTHYTLYQNGAVVADVSDGSTGAELTGIPSAPTVYREVFDTDFSGAAGVSQSTNTHTDVTFRYTPGSSPADTLPSSDVCDLTGGAMVAPCQILPVLELNYRLLTDDQNTSTSPVQVLALDVGHLSYAGHGSRAAITSASVSVSFDGGHTWLAAFVAGTRGSYVAVWQNPSSAAGTSPELRVAATDAAGGSISQTVANAYTIAASAH